MFFAEVRRVLLLVAAVALVGLVAVVAPALSVERHRPEPVEFGMRAPLAELEATDDVRRFSSVKVQAPKRFNLVGFSWRGEAEPGIEVRVRGEDEEWGRWTEVPAHGDGAPDPGSSEGDGRGASAPVWSGQADYLQYRLSRRPRGLRLHFLNTTGTATALDRIETGLRSAVNDAVIAVAGLTSAGAAGDGPSMVSRRAWGAEDCPPRRKPRIERVKVAFVHHTVSANRYSRRDAKAMVLGICRYHRNVNGWDDIGYNFLVDRFGRIFVGRAGGRKRAVMAAHAQGFNDQSTGVASLGTHDSKRLSRRGVRAAARLIRWKLRQHGARPIGKATLVSGGGPTNRYRRGTVVRMKRISGHRDVSPAECPGNRLYRQLRDIRKKAAR